jgi:hypothetical protein
MPTVSEKKNKVMQHQMEANGIQTFADNGMSDAIKALRDIKVNRVNRTVSAFDKEVLRSYLQNISSNESNLRNLSRYLAYRAQVYYRLIVYYASMLCMEARTVIPPFDLTQEPTPEEMLRIYQDNLVVLDGLNLQYEMLKAALVCWREDVFYGCNYYDETGHFIFQLDPDYCKINGQYKTGDFAFVMDMTYFRGKETLLELLDEPFVTMYNQYGGDNQERWQQMPDEYCVCFKIRSEDWETVVPPLIGIFNSLINLSDLEDIEAIADEQVIYKLLWLELQTITNTDTVDDWKVDPEIVKAYYNKMIADALPPYISGIISPVPINEISFPNDAASDTTKVQKATESVLNTSGGAQILNAATISGAEAFRASIKSDTEHAISSILPQIQAWVNRFLSYQVSTPCKVKFFEVSVYTKDELRKNLLESCQYGLPNKLALNCLMGFSERETISMNFLEEKCLDVTSRFVPLQSSFTTSGADIAGENGGRPKSDEQTTDGEHSEDARDRANG